MRYEIAAFARRLEMKAADQSAPGTFTGYGALFDTMCPTSAWDLPYDWQDVFAPGAFAKTLQERKKNGGLFPACWQHDLNKPIGSYPVIEEDDTGLRLEGKLATKTALGAECYELMQIGAISGLSVQYKPTQVQLDEKAKVRTLQEVVLYEISPVTVPNMDGARVADVKSLTDDQSGQVVLGINAIKTVCEEMASNCEDCKAGEKCGHQDMLDKCKALLDTCAGEGKRRVVDFRNVRDFEGALRSLGMSRGEAKAIIAGGHALAFGSNDNAAVIAAMERLTRSIRG